MPEDSQIDFFKYVLRTRKAVIPFTLNGRTKLVGRTLVRDYLREKYPTVKNHGGLNENCQS